MEALGLTPAIGGRHIQLLLLFVMLLPVTQALPNFNSTSTETTIIVTWTADPSSTLNSFEIKIDDDVKFTGDRTNLQSASSHTIPLLMPGASYEVLVEGINMDGIRLPLMTKIQVTKPLSPAVSSVGQADVGTDRLRFTWSPNPQSTQSNFRVEHQDISENGQKNNAIVQASVREYLLTDLKPGHNYSISVQSISDTEFSTPATIYENTVPLPPNITSLIATGTHELFISWAPAAQSLQSSFRVTYESLGSNTPSEVMGCGNTVCTIQVSKTFSAGQQIQVKVYAIQGQRTSEAATRIGNTQPEPVKNLRVNTDRRQATSLMVLWEEPPSYTTFRVTVDPDEGTGSSPSKDGNNWMYTQNGLFSGKQYTFSVFTLSGEAESDPVLLTAYTRPPQPPAPIRAEGDTADSLNVRWSAPQSTGAFDRYRITLTNVDGSPVSREVGKSGLRLVTFNSLRPGAKFVVSLVTVVGSDVESLASSAELYVNPLEPRNMSLVVQARDQLKVRWQEPSSTPPNSFNGFVISIKDVPGSTKNLSYPSTLEATFSNLNPGTLYTVEVSTVSGTVKSTPLSRSYYTKPNMPRSLRQVAVTNRSINIEWSAPQLLGNNRGYDGYYLHITPPGGQTATIPLSRDQTSHTFMDLYPGTEYDIELFSYISDASSEPASITVLTKPSSPRSLQLVSKTSTDLAVQWRPPATGSIDAYFLRIVPRNPGEYTPEQELNSGTLSYTYAGLQAGRTYDVHVSCKKNSQQSEAAVLTVTMNPMPAQNLEVTYSGTTSVEIRWDEPYSSSFDGFRIMVKNQIDSIITEHDVSGQTKTYNIQNLEPGRSYTVTLNTLSNFERSASVVRQFATSPEGVATIEPVDIKTDAIEIRWSAPNHTEFSYYDLSIGPNDGGLSLPVRVDRYEKLNYRFQLLRPGVLYNISIQVVTTHGTASRPFFREIGTMPSGVTNVNTAALSTSSIQISWDVDPNSAQSKFVVSYGVRGGSFLTREEPYDFGKSSYAVQLNNLLPGNLYEIAISAFSSTQGNPIVVRQATQPKSIQDLQVSTESSDSLRLTWGTASDSQQSSFLVRYTGKYIPSQMTMRQKEFNNQEGLLENLFPGERYTIDVLALSSGVQGQAVTKSQNTYPLPPDKLAVDKTTLETTTARITWIYNPEASYVQSWLVRHAIQGRGSWKEETINSASVMDMILSNLEAGQKYTVEVYGVADNLKSHTAAVITVNAKPSLTSVLTKDNSTTTDTLVLTYTESVGEFDHYIFSIGDKRIQKSRADKNHRVEFVGLIAGTRYTVKVQTVSGDVGSRSSSHVFNTKPKSPTVLTDQSENSITLTIERPAGVVDNYVVRCSVADPGAVRPCVPAAKTERVNSAQVVFRYIDLVPHTRYRFSVTSQVNDDHSMPVVKFVKTEQAAPGQVRDFTAEAIAPDKVILKWMEPIERNGVITNYSISYRGEHQDKVFPMQEQFVDASSRSFTVENLKGGYRFTFIIRAVTVENGEPTQVVRRTPVGKPYMAKRWLVPKSVNGSKPRYNQFSVQLVDPFSDQNGAVVSYTVVVTNMQPNQHMDKYPELLSTWARTIGAGQSGTYQAIDKCADLFLPTRVCGKGSGEATDGRRRRRALNDEVIFMVGEEDCPNGVSEYCNGRVMADETYYVKLRGFTENGDFTDTDFSGPIKTAAAPPDASMTVLIAVIVVLVILFIIMALAILFVLYRRGIICSQNDQSSLSRASSLSMPRLGSLRYRRHQQMERSRPVKVAEFGEHWRVMSADSDFKFSEEYEDLKPVGRDQTTIAAELPCNRNKNRFTNILPYDHSRVKLLPTDDEEGTDYINANYMPGFNSKREFIVTQGPLPSTRDDYWRMVWEQNCRAIVMLTKCVEKGREKCDHYWPIDSEPMFYGDLQVLILNETKCPEWIVTEFRISKGEQSRNIKHFHYIAWPDFGVPQRPQSLIRFVRLVRSKMPPDGGPIIAHCSAGVGRSGAYIAVDHILLDMAVKSETIDIFGITQIMREHRSQMVQTEQQYICIHACILCVIEGRENEPSPYSGEDNDAFDDDEGITMDTN